MTLVAPARSEYNVTINTVSFNEARRVSKVRRYDDASCLGLRYQITPALSPLRLQPAVDTDAYFSPSRKSRHRSCPTILFCAKVTAYHDFKVRKQDIFALIFQRVAEFHFQLFLRRRALSIDNIASRHIHCQSGAGGYCRRDCLDF